jgi:hypothetical protein
MEAEEQQPRCHVKNDPTGLSAELWLTPESVDTSSETCCRGEHKEEKKSCSGSDNDGDWMSISETDPENGRGAIKSPVPSFEDGSKYTNFHDESCAEMARAVFPEESSSTSVPNDPNINDASKQFSVASSASGRSGSASESSCSSQRSEGIAQQKESFSIRVQMQFLHCHSRLSKVSAKTKAILFLLAASLLLMCVLSIAITLHQKRESIFGRHHPQLRPPCNSTLVGMPIRDDFMDHDKTLLPTMAPTTSAVGTIMERLDAILHDDTEFDPHFIQRSSPQYQAIVWMASELNLEDIDSNQQFLQLYVLATCYFAWDGKEWNVQSDEDDVFNSKWLTVVSVCDWMGVGCRNDTIVTSLSLPQRDLWGTIVSELGLLQSLRVLDLSNNQLRGSIPSELGRLAALQSLNLSNNQYLSGSFPLELTTLSSLESVLVQGNPDLSSGMRNFMPCDHTPPTLVADCGVPDNGVDENVPPKQAQILCPCCTECCHYTDPATNLKGGLVCLEHEPYIDQKSLAKSLEIP